MSLRASMIFIFALVAGSPAQAQELSIREWIDLMVDGCVASGSTFTVDGKVDAQAGIALRKLGPHGTIAGQLTIKKSEYRLLQEGISSKMSEVAADQASEVRKCLAPTRAILHKVMAQQLIGPGAPSALQILSPYEDRVMQVLAHQAGEDGKIGSVVLPAVLQERSGLSELRFDQAIKALEQSVFLFAFPYPKVNSNGTLDTLRTYSLTDRGRDYVLEMGYAQ
jgi:hypothetical protein